MSTGITAQLGVASETTYGQAVTVTRFYPLVSESVTQEIERLESEGIITGARVLRSNQWGAGRVSVSGDLQLELLQQNAAVLFENMLGSITHSFAAGVGTHTATPGTLTGKSMTVQIGRPGTAGTTHPFTYAGVKVASWELAVVEGQIATLGLSILGQTETDQIALASASFGTDAAKPFTYMHGAVTISSSTVCVRELTVSGNNQLSTDRRCIGQSYVDQPLEMALREYTGTAVLEFTNLTQYERFVDATECPLVLTMSASSTAQCVATMNVRFDGVTPNVGDRDIIVLSMPFKAVAASTDSGAISFTLKNTQSEL